MSPAFVGMPAGVRRFLTGAGYDIRHACTFLTPALEESPAPARRPSINRAGQREKAAC